MCKYDVHSVLGMYLDRKMSVNTAVYYYAIVTSVSRCKVRPRTGHDGPEGEQRYMSTLSLTSALDGVGG